MIDGLRVLQLISSRGYYGAENMAVQLSLALGSLNCHVVLGVFQNVQEHGSELVKAAGHVGVNVEIIQCEGKVDLRTISAIRKSILERRIDVVHTHGYKANIYGYLATRGTNAKLVATCHNWPGKTNALRLYAALDRIFLRRFSKIGAVSSTVRDVLTKSGVPAEQIRLIANGIDTEKFSQGRPILKALPQLQGKRVVGFVGRLVREKGLAYLMQAAQSVLVDDSRIAFVLAGDGPFRKELFSIAKDLKIENDVFLLGPRSDLADVYASMDVFVLPSLIEGMPMVVLEAMAAGKPILATRVGGIPQLLQDGKCGILVNAEDASQLAFALKQLLASPTLCEELGRQGQKRVGTEFSATVMAKSYLEMYRNCLRPEHASN